MSTVVSLIGGPLNGTTVDVPAPWPRAQIRVPDGPNTHTYRTSSEAPAEATYVAPAAAVTLDQLDQVVGPPGDQGPAGPEGPVGPAGPAGVGTRWLGAFDPLAEYVKLDAVSYGGSSYVLYADTAPVGTLPTDGAFWAVLAAKGVDGAAGAAGAQGAQGVPGLLWRGAWNAGTAYAVNDAVTFNGASYRRLVAGTTPGLPDADVANWALFAAKGDAGPVGASGNAPRTDVAYATAALADGADEVGTLALGKSWRAMRVTTDKAARVRLYATAPQRDADRGRAIGVDPVQGTDHGLLMEYVTTAANLSAWLTPEAVGANGDTPVTPAAYITVQNRSGAAGAVTVTITEQVLE